MAEKQAGRASTTGLVMGEVMNRKDDPTQTGQCKVKWNMGQASQSNMSEDDLPWSKSMMSKHSASIKGVGGPHTGYLEGSKVYGLSTGADGQDFVILGSVPSGGSGSPDGQPTYDSDIPQPGKTQNNGQGGGSQPKYGDMNGVSPDIQDKSIIQYAQEQGGKRGAMMFPDQDDSAGTTGGSDGPEGSATNTALG